MDKILQDQAWRALPEDVREYVQDRYNTMTRLNEFSHQNIVYRDLFGEHNLTSHHEFPEMFRIPKCRVVKQYEDAIRFRYYAQKGHLGKDTFDVADSNVMLIHALFGKYNLPSESEMLKNVIGAKKQKSSAELLDKMNSTVDKALDALDKKRQSDFKIGDTVRVKAVYTEPGSSKGPYYGGLKRSEHFNHVFRIIDIFSDGLIRLDTPSFLCWEPSDLEHYTAPKFKEGDIVEVINYDFGLPSLDRCVHKKFKVSGVKYIAGQYMYKLETDERLFDEYDYLNYIQWREHFLQLAEPRFKPGDKVFTLGDAPLTSGRSAVVLKYENGKYFIFFIDYGYATSWYPADKLKPLEPSDNGNS